MEDTTRGRGGAPSLSKIANLLHTARFFGVRDAILSSGANTTSKTRNFPIPRGKCASGVSTIVKIKRSGWGGANSKKAYGLKFVVSLKRPNVEIKTLGKKSVQ